MFIEILRRLHRWISLILAPLFLVIVVSGALLTLEPILGAGGSRPRAPVDTAALTRPSTGSTSPGPSGRWMLTSMAPRPN